MIRQVTAVAVVALVFVATGACAGVGDRVLEGSGDTVTADYDVDGATKVVLAAPGDLAVSIGEDEGLVVEADDNVMPQLVVESRGETLELSYDRDEYNEIRPTRLDFTLVVSDLSSLEIQGSGRAEVEAVRADSLDVRISGSGRVQLPDIECGSLSVDVSGSGEIVAAGSSASLRTTIGGSGRVEAADLEADSADVDISGSGKATVWAVEDLTANISGSGTVYYYGDPETRLETSGSGGMERLER